MKSTIVNVSLIALTAVLSTGVCGCTTVKRCPSMNYAPSGVRLPGQGWVAYREPSPLVVERLNPCVRNLRIDHVLSDALRRRFGSIPLREARVSDVQIIDLQANGLLAVIRLEGGLEIKMAWSGMYFDWLILDIDDPPSP